MNKQDKNEMILLIGYCAITLFSVIYLGFSIFVYNNIAVTISILLIQFIISISMIITFGFDVVVMLLFATNLICAIGLMLTIAM